MNPHPTKFMTVRKPRVINLENLKTDVRQVIDSRGKLEDNLDDIL